MQLSLGFVMFLPKLCILHLESKISFESETRTFWDPVLAAYLTICNAIQQFKKSKSIVYALLLLDYFNLLNVFYIQESKCNSIKIGIANFLSLIVFYLKTLSKSTPKKCHFYQALLLFYLFKFVTIYRPFSRNHQQ